MEPSGANIPNLGIIYPDEKSIGLLTRYVQQIEFLVAYSQTTEDDEEKDHTRFFLSILKLQDG